MSSFPVSAGRREEGSTLSASELFPSGAPEAPLRPVARSQCLSRWRRWPPGAVCPEGASQYCLGTGRVRAPPCQPPGQGPRGTRRQSACAPALDCSAHLAADRHLAAVLFSLCLALYPHQWVCALSLWWRVYVNVWCFSPGFVPLLNPVQVCAGDLMCVSGATVAHLSSLTLIWPVV